MEIYETFSGSDRMAIGIKNYRIAGAVSSERVGCKSFLAAAAAVPFSLIIMVAQKAETAEYTDCFSAEG